MWKVKSAPVLVPGAGGAKRGRARLLDPVLALLVIGALVVAGSSPADANAPGINYAGQRTQVVFTGIWGFIGTASVPTRQFGSTVAHWMGKTNFAVTEWAQAGWLIDCAASCTTPYLYLEYRDKNGGYQLLEGMGSPTVGENNQFAIWGDGSGGTDYAGPYFRTLINVREGPDQSPIWVTVHTDLWHRCDANAELYNATNVNEAMGTVDYGWNGFAFLDLAVYDSGSTLWSLWDSRTTPQIPSYPPYTYTNLQSPDWYHFRVSGP